MMESGETNYTRVEYERRFLVSSSIDWRPVVEPYSKHLLDKYIRNSRLRLRLLTDSDTGRQVFKLNKKFESSTPYFQTVSRILLSPAEYEIFDQLEGDRLSKTRYYHNYHGQLFSIDVFEGELAGLVLSSIEVESLEELMQATPPEYIQQEVTEDPFFTGGNLSRTTRVDLQSKMATLGQKL